MLKSSLHFLRLSVTLFLADMASHFASLQRPGLAAESDVPGITVLIPERGTPALLRQTLDALFVALAKIVEPAQIIVLVNGSARDDYLSMVADWPKVEWHFKSEALGFNEAIRCGVALAGHDWLYLLNSDMRLDAHAFAELLMHRGDDVFAIASQIFFEQSQRRREETGWTDFTNATREVELFDEPPIANMGVRPGLYAGGGSSLFRTRLLRRYVAETEDYSPFYFEDAEWGVRAWREGNAVLFSPRSIAWHHHRATIAQFYSQPEIERILRRNRVLFDLRNAWTRLSALDLVRNVLSEDRLTITELTRTPVLSRMLRARAQALSAKRSGFDPRNAMQARERELSTESIGGSAHEPDHEDSLLSRMAPRPRILWIELTSRCPFDCIFCSRKLLRGAGMHMDFDMFRNLIAELNSADIIRLNYSGESAHYPKLVEACELAASTGARVEFVTALAALPEHKVEALVLSGITRLTISLHTLDPQQFMKIYRFSSLAAMQKRIESAIGMAAGAARALQIDFAFVAMQRNIDQLCEVAGYASKLGISRLAVHPVIRRDPIEETFDDELDNGTLRAPFVALLNAAIAQVRSAHPLLTVESSTPELEFEHSISTNPSYHPGPLPPGAIIHSCDQDPWETVHVLANGDIVVCEQRDQVPLGNLRNQSLAEIWRSPAYMKFRSDYVAARDKHCAACPYKKAALPSRLPDRFEAPDIGRTSLLDGWFADDGGDIAWSRCRALLELRGHGRGRLLLRGYLPAVRRGRNKLEIRVDGASFATVSNRNASLLEFRIERPFVADGKVRVEFNTALEYCPAEQSGSKDSRKLGFALVEAAFSNN